MKRSAFPFMGVAGVLALGCQLLASAAGEPMTAVIHAYEADAASVDNFYRIPCSEAALDRRERLGAEWLARLRGMPFEALDQTGRVDYVLLRNELENRQAQLGRERQRLAEMATLLPFRSNIVGLALSSRLEAKLDAPAAATAINDLAAQVKALKERVERGRNAKPAGAGAEAAARDAQAPATNAAPPLVVPPALAARTAEAVARLRDTLKAWFARYDGFNPAASWWLKQPCEEADKALEEYGKLLREEVAGQKGKDDDPLVGDPCGAEAVAADRGFEFIPYDARELIALGEGELAWGEAEMRKAAREMGCGDDWHAALRQVEADHVEPGEQDELVAQTCRAAIAFVKAHDFVTIPPLCEETWQVAMMSPQTLKQIPYAAYNDQNMMVAYASEGMRQEDKLMVMRGNNRAFTRLTTAHELIPGHHLQLYVAARHNPQRELFRTPFYIEGWAFYTEMRLWELGWARTPQERIGMLFWRMNRGARTVCSLKFHLGQMTPDEMVAFMIGRVGHQKFGATGEVRRIIGAAPLYQTAYLLGGRQFLALHDELVLHGRLTERQFHDAVLAEGALPLELLRAALEGVPLKPDTAATWKFAGEHPGAGR